MKLLVVGMGSIGQRHVRNLRALRDVDILAYRRRGYRLPEDLRVGWLREFYDLDAALSEGPQAALVCAPPTFVRRQSWPSSRVTLCPAHPLPQRLRRTADLLRDRTDRRPL